MAVAGLGVAMEMGVSVPGDLSIVAFDDSILTQLMHPALTALSRDTFDFGRQAAEVLLEVIADPTQRGQPPHRRPGPDRPGVAPLPRA